MDGDPVSIPCSRGTMASKSRCRTCYQRERIKDPAAKSMEIKKRCANPTNGCIVCNEYVCASCWPLHVQNVQRRRMKGQNDDTKSELPIVAKYQTESSGSVVIESFLATNDMKWKKFLDTQWEKKSHLFTYNAEILPISSLPSLSSTSSVSPPSLTTVAFMPIRSLVPSTYGGDGCWRETSMIVFPLRETIRQGWHILATCMSAGYDTSVDGTIVDQTRQISVFQNFQPQTREDIESLYNGDLHESYLSGCSITWENCDLISPYIRTICQDLQSEQNGIEQGTPKKGAFDKVYATAHLNPPSCSEPSKVKTSNRNIIVFQLVGRNYWKTHWSTSGDQSSDAQKSTVGTSFEGYLYPGDILYVPKGMCYQSQTQGPSEQNNRNENGEDEWEPELFMSFDVTFALEKPNGFSTTISESEEDIDLTTSTAVEDTIEQEYSAQKLYNGKTNISKDTKEKKDPTEPLSNSDDRSMVHVAVEMPREFSTTKRIKIDSECRRTKTTKFTTSGARSDSLDHTIGPVIASQISFHSVIRKSTSAEQSYCKDLRSSRKFYVGIDERRNSVIRPELRDVTESIVTRLRSLTFGESTKTPYIRVCNLCELVKESSGDNKKEICLICDLTILALVKREIENGNLAVQSL